MKNFKLVESAIKDLQQGKMVILTDHPEREDEGDLIMAAEKITTAGMNFFIRHTSGIVCISLEEAQLKLLQLPLMVPFEENTSLRGTPFTISIDAKVGITTGVSAADRVKTIQTLVEDNVSANDLARPGHIFPLAARNGGCLERQGHTEGAIDLVKLAGFKAAAVLCEVMNPDGTMARGNHLKSFAKEHHLTMLSIEDIVAYRLFKESKIEDETSSQVFLEKYGNFKISVIKEKFSHLEHVILTKNLTTSSSSYPLIRIHSSCVTGDLFLSKHCDCYHQLHYALQRISEEGGMIIYLNQEGRGIGLFNKIKAYSLQEQGYDTVTANQKLGLPVDSRRYDIAANILHRHDIKRIRLLTNNPDKIHDLKLYGISEIIRESMPSFQQMSNQFYLKTKKQKLNHMIDIANL